MYFIPTFARVDCCILATPREPLRSDFESRNGALKMLVISTLSPYTFRRSIIRNSMVLGSLGLKQKDLESGRKNQRDILDIQSRESDPQGS